MKSIHSSSPQLIVDAESNDDPTAFHEWRIENQIPWNGYEVTNKNHPLSAGLNQLVHPSKGCYIGQEVLARMISRGRQGKKFTRVENGTIDDKYITTQGQNHSLAIIRESNQ